MTQPTLSPAFQALPSELIGAICNLLSNRDVKNLRLTHRYLRDTSPLRFDRVYISANPRNIEVLTAIANHDAPHHFIFLEESQHHLSRLGLALYKTISTPTLETGMENGK